MKLSAVSENIGSTYSISHYLEYKRTGNKNLFEEIIDRLIIEGVAGMNESFRNSISHLEPSKKRMAILSLLDKDRKLFTRIKALIDDKLISNMDHIKDVITMLREYVKVGDVEKKKFGEVMTPLELVKEMLATLPVEVWSNPNLKWLDPANGTGPYPIMVIYKLMNGLKDWEKDEEKRYKHIIENMIYVAELQPKNMFLYMCVVDPLDKYDLNIYTGSFLDAGFDRHLRSVWGFDKFDIVMGNYPYQEQKPGFTKTQPLWNLFVKKSMAIIEESGYMVTIHPSGWRNVGGVFKDVQNLLKSKQILELHIHNEKDGMKTFGADTRYDFYCVRNKECGDFESKIRCQDGTFDKANLSKLEFIPSGMFSTILQLVSTHGEEKTTIINNSSYHHQRAFMSKEKTDVNIYPCVYTVKSGDVPTIWWSNRNDRGHFNIPKLIWSNFRICSAGSIADIEGKFALTEFSSGLVDSPDNLLNVKKAFDTKKFRDLMELCAVNEMSINRKVIATFRRDFWKEFI